MPFCAVPGCGSSSKLKVRDFTDPNPTSFHRFPDDPRLRQVWIDFVGRPEVTKHSTVCSKHFAPGLIRSAGMRSVIAPNSCPTLNKPPRKSARLNDGSKRRRKPYQTVTFYSKDGKTEIAEVNVGDVCIVPGCSNTGRDSLESQISFHSFPKELNLKTQWLDFVGRDPESITKFSKICSKHFAPDFIRQSGSKKILNHGAVPTILVPHDFPLDDDDDPDYSDEDELEIFKTPKPEKKPERMPRIIKSSVKTIIDSTSSTITGAEWEVSPNSSDDEVNLMDSTFDDPESIPTSSATKVVTVQQIQTKPFALPSKTYNVQKSRVLTKAVTPTAGTSINQKEPIPTRVKTPTMGQKGPVLTKVITPGSSTPQKVPVQTKVVFQNRSPNGPVLTKIDLPKTVQVQKGPNQLPVGPLKLIPISNLQFQKVHNSHKVQSKIITAAPPSSDDSSEDEEDWDLHSSLRVETPLPPPVKTTPATQVNKELSLSEIVDIFKSKAQTPWSFVEFENELKLCRTEYSKDCRVPLIGTCVTINKTTGDLNVLSHGEELNPRCFSPKDFRHDSDLLKPTTANVTSFIETIMRKSPLNWSPYDMLKLAKDTVHSVTKRLVDLDESVEAGDDNAEWSRIRLLNPALDLVQEQLQAVTNIYPYTPDLTAVGRRIRSISEECYNYLRNSHVLLLPSDSVLNRPRGFKRKPIGKVFAEENKIAGGKRKLGESAVVENFLHSFEKSSSTKNVSTLASEWPAVNEQMAALRQQQKIKRRATIKAEIRVIVNLVKRGFSLETAKKSLRFLTENHIKSIVDRKDSFRESDENFVTNFCEDFFDSTEDDVEQDVAVASISTLTTVTSKDSVVASTSQSNPTATTQVQPPKSATTQIVYPRITQVQPKPVQSSINVQPITTEVQTRPKKLIIPRGMVMVKRADVSKRNHEEIVNLADDRSRDAETEDFLQRLTSGLF